MGTKRNTTASNTISVSIRNIVEFILRSGSIVGGTGIGGSYQNAWEGTKLHQKIQKKRKQEAVTYTQKYEKEVSLKLTIEYKDITFNIDGRADGIITGNNELIEYINIEEQPLDLCSVEPHVVIEEIKSTTQNIDELVKDTTHWHWAQAKCYGYMYLQKNPGEIIRIAVTYGQLTEDVLAQFSTADTDAVEAFSNHTDIPMITFYEDYTKTELETFFFDLIERYYVFAKMELDNKQALVTTAKSANFPFTTYRKGQRELAVSVYAAIKQSKKLFAQAPTGTGKTISVLYPSIKALGEGLCEKIFYLTAKTITRKAAEEAFELLSEKGLICRAITITAKDKICPHSLGRCDPMTCEYAIGHFDRVNEALLDIVTNECLIFRKKIEQYAEKHKVCPYEYSLDIALFCDTVICDYNYVYDPRVHLRRFFDKNKCPYVLLNDESHNLVDRAREMYSAKLLKSQFVSLKSQLKKKTPIYRATDKIIKYFNELRKTILQESNNYRSNIPPKDLYLLLEAFMLQCEILLKEGEEDFVLEMFFAANEFLSISEYFDERYITFIEGDKTDISIKLFCVDPSFLLHELQKKILASIFFSATLTPLEYFREILGGENSDFILKLQSPFEKDNFRLLIENRISTKYADREFSYEKIADSIYQMTTAKQGNYFIFFSSYEYLSRVLDIFAQKYSSIDLLVQSKNMAEEDRESFLENFKPDNPRTLAAFAVMGGIFSEGIDLKGDRLIGVCVVGVGLPMITGERDVIKDYYIEKNGAGFEFAYMYPGMNKVLQAAGRLIRSETDRGVVLLIDNRFLTSRYLSLFPNEWLSFLKVSNPLEIKNNTLEFWR